MFKILTIEDDINNFTRIGLEVKKDAKNSYKIIAKSIMVALNDRKLNYHEINNIVNQMERAANSYR